MMSFRTIARSAPRALSLASARMSAATPARTAAFARAVPLLRAHQAAAFSTSSSRGAKLKPSKPTAVAVEKAADADLIAKLDSELKFEKDMAETEQVPAAISDFLQNSPFKILDTPGEQNVVLTRDYGSEKITVEFSIADLQEYGQEAAEDEDTLGDEDFDGEDLAETPKQQKRGRQSEPVPEDEDLEDELEGEGDEEDGSGMSVPSNLNIIVEKPGKGAMRIAASIVQNSIVVESVYYFDKPEMAYISSKPEVQDEASQKYSGPAFGTLDEDLQILMERYLEDRGISQELADFIPQYMEVKEQKEYLNWLESVKSFVKA